MCFYFSVLSSSKHSIVFLSEIQVFKVCYYQTTSYGEIKSKIRNTYSYPSFQKHCLTSHIDIGGHKKKEVTGNSKTTTLPYFDKLKKK